jgi:hypothetical protein
MMRQVTAALLFVSAVSAQVPVDQLSKPPAGAQAWSILSTGGTHGKAALWVSSDGRLMCRESILLRGQVWETDQSVKLGADGLPDEYVVRGSNPSGDAAETFSISDGVAKWKSPVDSGSAPYKTSFYIAQGGSISGSLSLLIESLLKSTDKSIALLPGGRASAVKLTDLTVGSGATACDHLRSGCGACPQSGEHRAVVGRAHAMEIEPGVEVSVLGLETPIAVKEELGFPKDAAVLPLLRQALKERSERNR